MSRAQSARPPWLSLAGAAAAWFVYQQGLGTVVRLACASSAAVGIAGGVIALAACAACGLSALGAANARGSEPPDRATRFIGWVAVGAAATMSLAVVFQMLATLIVPPCAR